MVRRRGNAARLEPMMPQSVRLASQIEKLVPQPHDAVALGLTTRNDAPIKSSTKSTSEPREERHRGWIDQHHGVLARDHQVILGLGAVDVELVLEAGAAAALDGDAQHGAVAFGFEDFADAAGGPLADGDGCTHGIRLRTRHTQFIWYGASDIVKCVISRNQMDKE